jgi:3'(2'), 5'-bisphosphate nucleotidase
VTSALREMPCPSSSLAHALTVARPQDAVLSEEARDNLARLAMTRVWIIDPLDGTREYGEGREDWAVHIALVTAGTPTAAAVALPALGTVLDTAAPRHATTASTSGRLRIAVSRTRPPAEATALERELDAELVPMGSAGFKVAAVLRGKVDAYIHAGGQYEWDSAAPVGIALAAGLHASRLDGSPLLYNNKNPSLPDLVVCPSDLAEPILSVLADTSTADIPLTH